MGMAWIVLVSSMAAALAVVTLVAADAAAPAATTIVVVFVLFFGTVRISWFRSENVVVQPATRVIICSLPAGGCWLVYSATACEIVPIE